MNFNKIFKVALILFSVLINSCNFFTSFINESQVEITAIEFGKTELTIQAGDLEYISISVKPADCQKKIKLSWDYDSSIIECGTSSNWGVTIKGLSEGQTTLHCSYGDYDAVCLVTVSGYSENYKTTTEPYIYSNYSILQTSPGISEKVFVSLYGGDAGDIDGYTWTIDNSSVATIQPTGQYCIVSAKSTGYARIKITHIKAAYPYYIGIYVFEDATNISYITTSSNIVTMNMEDDEQAITVSLVNEKDSSLDSQFHWEILNEDEDSPVELSWNGNNAVVSPKKSGSCTIRVTHPDAVYPLDILCRVISIVKNVYIEPEETVVTLDGETRHTVSCTLNNIDIGDYDMDGFEYRLDDYNVAQIISSIGNKVILQGIANGSCKLIISHEKALYSREVLVIAQNQLKDAVDSSCYITTSQNYIRTKVGADEQIVNISLKGGLDGDEEDFKWNVSSSAADGSTDNVILLETLNGSVFHTSSRAAAATYSYGSAQITPLKEGTAVISITHPKIVYPTEILVKVLGKDAIIDEPLYFTGNGIVKILNGDSQEYEVQLKGDLKSENDYQDISWTCDTEYLNLNANGSTVVINAPPAGSGNTSSYIYASHPKSDIDKKVLVLTADDSDSLKNIMALYSDKTYYSVEDEESVLCSVSTSGFDEDYDFSSIVWSVKNPDIIGIEKSSYNPLNCKVTGLKSGITTLTASIDDIKCVFNITVLPKGTVNSDSEIYFTTNQNVINLKCIGNSSTLNVTAVNMKESEFRNIEWNISDDSVAKITGNGVNATLVAKKEGECVVSVSHKDSQNILKIYVKVGSEYVIPEIKQVVYISSNDVMTFLKDGATQCLKASLVNYDGNDSSDFIFDINDSSVAEITAQSPSGICYIKPVDSGQAQITITSSLCDVSKKVLIIVGNSEEELSGVTYLTTASNVVAVGEGNTKTVSVSVKNASSAVIDGYIWSSSNPAVVDVQGADSSAVLKGNGIGTAVITVKNNSCQYPLTIIAQCVDPIEAAANPYIQLSSSVLTLEVGSTYTSVSADLVGGDENDNADFLWTVNDSSVCNIYGQNEIGKIRALKQGQTYVTVSHPKTLYTAQLLVVCDEPRESDCYISVPSSIISMKPTDSLQTLSATLVNGNTTDKYNFKWSLDVYDIVDIQYSANVCTITPKQAGTATITITHPKAAYDQQIIVNVQEYTTFSFPQNSLTLTKGSVEFLDMEVPVTSVTTHVEYSTDNCEICMVNGTKNVVQITGINNGTTTVYARLVASSTGAVQAETEMLVYVKQADSNSVYITSSSTIYTVNKGKSQTLSATLSGSGVTTSDQYNLKWTTDDTDIISITGINTDGMITGQTIYITANKSGEALITCSHEKAASNLQFYVVVPGNEDKIVSLNKTYMTLTKGSSGSSLKATIENSESSNDYYDLEWNADKVNGNEIVRIMGSGQSVTVYPVAAGETTVTVQLPDSDKIARCTVIVEAGKSMSFENTSRKVQPFHTKQMKYTVSPADAVLTWTMSQEDDFFEYRDLGCDENGNGCVEITGMKEGTGTLVCVTDGSAKATCTVKVSWDYEFTVDTIKISGSPDDSYEVEYHVSPADATVDIKDNGVCYFNQTIDNDGNGKIIITPLTEGTDSITLKAKNPYCSNEEIGNKTISASFAYDKLNVNYEKIKCVSYKDSTKNARWSKFENDVITLGDGEKFDFNFSIDETKVKDLQITAVLKQNKNDYIQLEKASTSGEYILGHNEDTTESAYMITEGYKPTYKGLPCYPDGTTIDINDFYTSTGTDGYSYQQWLNPVYYEDHYNRCGWWILKNRETSSAVYEFTSGYGHEGTVTVSSTDKANQNSDWGVVRDESLDGTFMTVDEFQNSPWYYIPAFTVTMGGSCTRYLAHNYGEIDSNHIKATYFKVTSDTTVISFNQVDTLEVTFSHNGTKQVMCYPIYVEVRNCGCEE